MNIYKSVTSSSLVAIYNFTQEEINLIIQRTANWPLQIEELEYVNDLIYEELSNRL